MEMLKARVDKFVESPKMFESHEPVGPQMLKAVVCIRLCLKVAFAFRTITEKNAVENPEVAWTLVSDVTSLDFDDIKLIMQGEMENAPLKECDEFVNASKASKEWELTMEKALTMTKPTVHSCRKFLTDTINLTLVHDFESAELLKRIGDTVLQGDAERSVSLFHKAGCTELSREIGFVLNLHSVLKHVAMLRLARQEKSRKERKMSVDWCKQVCAMRVATARYKTLVEHSDFGSLFPCKSAQEHALFFAKKTMMKPDENFVKQSAKDIHELAVQDVHLMCNEWIEDAKGLITFMNSNQPENWKVILDDIRAPPNEEIKKRMVENMQAATRITNGAKLLKDWAHCFKQVNGDGSGMGTIFSHDVVLEMQMVEKDCQHYLDVTTHMRMILIDLPAIVNIPARRQAANKLCISNRNNAWGSWRCRLVLFAFHCRG